MTALLPLNNSHLPLKLTVGDYLMLDEAGAFVDYAKTELIEGEILFMNAQHRPHARIKSRLHILVANALLKLSDRMEAIVEGSLDIRPHSSPEPDIVVTDDPEGSGLIPLASVKLVIEVSDATILFDTVRKLALYARVGIQEYWVVDVNAGLILQHWSPVGDAYTERRHMRFGEAVTAVTIAGLTIDSSGL